MGNCRVLKMGNGTGTQAHQNKVRLNEFNNPRRIETLCKQNYFLNHRQDFAIAVQSAIQTNKLECLELLIAVGGIEEVRPLHIASVHKSFESIELLTSAGMSPYSLDDCQRTPLHCLCLKQEFDENICLSITQLYTYGKKAIYMFDSNGSTPIHCAVIAKNIDIIQTLFECGGLTIQSVPNKIGQSARAFAHQLGYHSIVKIIDKYRNIQIQKHNIPTKQSCTSTPTNRKVQKSVQSDDAPVDMERIMLIWETFFENALMTNNPNVTDYDYDDKEEEEEEGDDDDKGSIYSYTQKDKKINTKTTQSSTQKTTTTTNLSSELLYSQQPIQVSEGVVDWFRWILLQHQHKLQDGQEGYSNQEECEDVATYPTTVDYYVLNKDTGQTKWLEEHLWEQTEYYGLYLSSSSGHTTSYTSGSTDNITTVLTLITNGWMTYYNAISNGSFWYNLHSNTIETYLPIGLDSMIYSLNLYPFNQSDYADWVAADQTVTTTWCIIICPNETYTDTNNNTSSSTSTTNGTTTTSSKYKAESKWDLWEKKKNEKEEEMKVSSCSRGSSTSKSSELSSSRNVTTNEEIMNLIYYYNSMTGLSSWDRPGSWELVTESTGGWVRCCFEDSNEGYWWHEESGAVAL